MSKATNIEAIPAVQARRDAQSNIDGILFNLGPQIGTLLAVIESLDAGTITSKDATENLRRVMDRCGAAYRQAKAASDLLSRMDV